MAEGDEKGAKGASTQVESASSPKEEKHDVQYILDNARALTGHSRHAVAGALAGSDKKELTASAAKKATDEFLKVPAVPEEKKSDG